MERGRGERKRGLLRESEGGRTDARHAGRALRSSEEKSGEV